MAEGSIRKISAKKWYIRVPIGYDENGKRIEHREVVNGTKGKADERLTEVLSSITQGRYVKPTKQTVAAYLTEWLQAGAKPKLKDRTFRDYEQIVEKRIKPVIGSLALENLTAVRIQTFYSELLERLSPQTIRNVHTVLRSAMKQAVRWRILAHNPTADVDLPRQRKREMQALNTTVAGQFIDAAKQSARGIVYVVALATGMRPSEYLALLWSDVDLASGVVQVRRTLYRPKGGGWRFEDTKTAKSRRTVILPTSVLPLLRQHRAEQDERRQHAGDLYEDHNFVFATDLGAPLDICHMNSRYFKPILKAAGLPATLRPYDLRHSCATLLMEAGKSPKLVAERLGHSSTTMTMDVYSHVTPTMQQDAADTLDRFF